MSASCRNQAAAWEFMRQYLTEEHQTSEYMWNFPTNAHAFESYKEQAMTPVYDTDPETGEQIEIEASKAPVFKAGKALKDSVNK